MRGLTLWTLDEAAQILRISKSKLRQEERAGRLRFVRFGRVVRVDARDVDRYVQSARDRGARLPDEGGSSLNEVKRY